MKKSIICILLSLLLITGSLTFSTTAAEIDPDDLAQTSSMIYLTLNNGVMPKVGVKPCRSYTIPEADRDRYAILGMTWWNLTDDYVIPANSSETFQAGKTYALSVTFEAQGNYRFPSNTDDMALCFTRKANEPENQGMVNTVVYNEDNSEGASIRRAYACFRMDGDNTRTVCFLANGGKGSLKPVCVSTATKYTLPGCVQSSVYKLTPPAGLMFYGWGSKREGEKLWVTQDTQFTAEWVVDNSGKEKVSSVGINLNKAPKIGNKPDTGFTVSSTKYTASSVYWYDNTLGRDMLDHETFQAGRSYTLHVHYKPNSDFYFPDPAQMTASLGNVTQHTFVYQILEAGMNGYPNRVVEYEFNGLPQNVTQLTATVTKPRTGSKPVYTASSGTSSVTASVTKWYEGGTVNSPGRAMSSSETFKAGTTYIAELSFDLKKGYIFPDGGITCKVNSYTAAELTSLYPDFLRKYRIAFSTPAAGSEISSAALTIDPLEVGKSLPGEGDIAKDSFRYKATISNWYIGGTVNSPSSAVPGNRIVKAGEKYILAIRLTPISTEALADNIKVTINGKTAVRPSGFSADGSAVFNVEMVAGEIAQTVLLGDADGDGNISVYDATAIQRYLVSLPNEHFDPAAADADGENGVTVLDATEIQRYLVNLPANANIGKKI